MPRLQKVRTAAGPMSLWGEIHCVKLSQSGMAERDFDLVDVYVALQVGLIMQRLSMDDNAAHGIIVAVERSSEQNSF